MRWLPIICALIGLTSIYDAAPTGNPVKIDNPQSETTIQETTSNANSSSSTSSFSSSLSSARKLPTHDVGLPSELAWQAWLVVANKPDAQSSFESATVPRRISPKSVFVAPALQPACPDGYKSDTMGRCVKETIQINFKTHLEFILERLRAKFPSTVQLDDSAATGTEMKESAASGPLQVNISLGIEDNLSASRLPLSSDNTEDETNDEEYDEDDDSVAVSVVHVKPVDPLKLNGEDEPTLTVYSVGNGTRVTEEEEGTFFRSNSSQTLDDHSVREVVVPVAEFVDDGNRTFTQVIDYEIPISLGQLFNGTHGGSSDQKERNTTETKPTVNPEQQPTVVFLLSPTKQLATPTSAPYLKEPNSNLGARVSDQILVTTGILSVNATRKDEVLVKEAGAKSPSKITIVTEDEEVTSADDEFEETTPSGFQEIVTTTTYDEDDSDEATDLNDEILAHGEAGMLVSAGKLPPSNHPGESVKSTPIAEVPKSMKKTGEETDGNISSESSISGDVILETTLLDLNTATTPTHGKLDDLRELFEVDREPEVIFSPQDGYRLDRLSARGKKRAEEVTVPSSISKDSFMINPGDSTTLDSSLRETAMRPPGSKERLESAGSPFPTDLSHFQQRRTSSNQEYVRFPEDRRQSSSGYVMFPSDNTNSVNGNVNYKERTSFEDDLARSQSLPKNSVSLHQKKTYWRLPSSWKIDDHLQRSRQPLTIQNTSNQRQNPMLFRFWTRMPLYRDPSLTTTSNQSSRISPIVNQRDGIQRGISTQTANRVFGQAIREGRVIG